MNLVSRGLTLDLTQPQVMGILNVTPDSFSDGGQHHSLELAVEHAKQMIRCGATMIDIGGESTRPGAAIVSDEEEIARVIPVVEVLAKETNVWISVDTSKAAVITAAAKAGAHLINDIRSLSEPVALYAAQQTGLPVCLMHMQGSPQTMQQAPHYDDLMAEVSDYFEQQIKRCLDAGISKEKLILDPGFGFGKNLQHNYQLLEHLEQFHSFGLPILAGMSRKSMIGQLLDLPPSERVIGSVACAVIAAMKGARIIRVHDVKETVEAMKIVTATISAKESV